MTDKKAESVLQRLWLTYYNDTLFAKGFLTEAERNKMRALIRNRFSPAER